MLILPLLIPIVICTVVLFFASFLSWMVLGLHKQDWVGLSNEETLLETLRKINAGPGNYMFPSPVEAKTESQDVREGKLTNGPIGVLTIFPGINMGRNLGLTVVYFLAVSVGLAYLSRLGLPAGADFMTVLRFVSTAALMTFLSGVLQHAIWFRCRVTGHVIESIAYAFITGAIFAVFWPASF